MRETAEEFVGEAGQTCRLAHSRRELCAASPPQPAQWIGDDLKSCKSRVQAFAGILKDHLDAGTFWQAREFPRRHGADFLSVEPDTAAAWINEARDEPHQSRFAATGFPDKTHRLAKSYRKIHVIHGMEPALAVA
jgi:hypothetical protein